MSVHPALSGELAAEQRLALAYAPASARAATAALLALDHKLSAVIRARREPIAAQLRLAWWRERLNELSPGSVNAEPVLDALRAWREPACLAALPAGWEALLAEELTPEVVAQFASGRAEAFACLARELRAETSEAAAAARIWAVADLAAHLSSPVERDLAVRCGRALRRPGRLPPQLRSLAVLAGLGTRALRHGGAPLLQGRASALVALRIGLGGR